VGHRSIATLFHRQAGLGAVQRLDLRLLVGQENDGMGGWIDIEPDDVTQFVNELRIVAELELLHPMRLKAVSAPDALDELALMPTAFAIKLAVQWVVSAGGVRSAARRAFAGRHGEAPRPVGTSFLFGTAVCLTPKRPIPKIAVADFGNYSPNKERNRDTSEPRKSRSRHRPQIQL
jgi:hypothetical protein